MPLVVGTQPKVRCCDVASTEDCLVPFDKVCLVWFGLSGKASVQLSKIGGAAGLACLAPSLSSQWACLLSASLASFFIQYSQYAYLCDVISHHTKIKQPAKYLTLFCQLNKVLISRDCWIHHGPINPVKSALFFPKSIFFLLKFL